GLLQFFLAGRANDVSPVNGNYDGVGLDLERGRLADGELSGGANRSQEQGQQHTPERSVEHASAVHPFTSWKKWLADARRPPSWLSHREARGFGKPTRRPASSRLQFSWVLPQRWTHPPQARAIGIGPRVRRSDNAVLQARFTAIGSRPTANRATTTRQGAWRVWAFLERAPASPGRTAFPERLPFPSRARAPPRVSSAAVPRRRSSESADRHPRP